MTFTRTSGGGGVQGSTYSGFVSCSIRVHTDVHENVRLQLADGCQTNAELINHDAGRPVDVRQREIFVDVCLSTAVVHIVPFYANGSPSRLAVRVLSFESDDGGLELANHFKTNAVHGIPHGAYKLRAYAKGYWPVGRNVDVFQPTVWAIVSPSIGAGASVPGPSITLSGVVENLGKDDRPIYVRLLGLFWGGALDGRVKVSGISGAFTIGGMLRDRMATLLVLGPGWILGHRLIDLTQLTPRHPLLIPLPKQARTAQPPDKR